MSVKERKGASLVLPKQVVITIGVHAEDAAEAHAQAVFADDGAFESPSAVTVGDVATWMEFGTRTVPARSFVRSWFDENQSFITETLQKQFAAVAAGKRDAETAAERCALAFEGSVKQRISRGIPPPLAPATIARKGSSKQLIDTGQLRNAVRGKAEVK